MLNLFIIQPRLDQLHRLRSQSQIFLLAALFSFLSQTGTAQCNFSVGSGATVCEYSYTSQVSGVDGYFLEHLWAFGDGSTSDVANPIHSYPSIAVGGASQNYTVTHTVIVRDPFTLLQITGSPFVCTQTVTVNSSSSCQLCPPVGESGAIFNYHVTGCTVNFQAILGSFFTYNWSFGDGTSAINAGPNVSHTYAEGVWTAALSANMGLTTFRCNRRLKTDCSKPSSEFTYTLGGGDCGCFYLNLVPDEQTAGATYGWWVNGQLVATGANPNLFPHGIDVCAIQQSGGKIKLSLVVQLNGESSPLTTKEVDLSTVTPAIYIGYGGSSGNLSDYTVLPGSSYCGTCLVKVCGIVTVDKDFEFCGSEVEFSPGNTGFDVNPNKTLRLTGGAHFHGCECIWRGVKMQPQSNIAVLGHSIIEDAGYAIDVLDHPSVSPVQLNLDEGIFRNNYIGVRITGRATFNAFTKNLFTTTTAMSPPLWSDCMHILPGSYTPNIGYTGMYIDHQGGSTITLPNDNNLNTFSNLAFGIQSFGNTLGGTLSLDHTATFENINTCGEYQPEGGTAIYFRDDASFTAIGNVFRVVKTGIWGETNLHTDLNIASNNMSATLPTLSVARGIHLAANKQGDMDGTVDHNTITVNYVPSCYSGFGIYAFGIAFADNTSLDNILSIASNTITLNCSIAETHGIALSADLGSITTPATIEVDVDDNTITGQDASTGIEVKNIRMAAVHGNTINLSLSNSINGIAVGGAENCNICFNTVTNTSGNNKGLAVTGARYNNFVHNVFNSTAIGASFAGDCGGAYIACNEFNGSQGTGLLYTNTAYTDVQWNTGNTWNGTFTNAALISVGNPSFASNVYVVPECITPPCPFNPGNTQSQGGIFWFDDQQFVDPPDCSSVDLFGCDGFNRPANGEAADRTAPAALDSEMSFQVVPNPNRGECTVRFDQVLDEAASLQIVTSAGALVRIQNVAAGASSYDITDLPAGVYFVTVTSKGKVSAPKKVVVF